CRNPEHGLPPERTRRRLHNGNVLGLHASGLAGDHRLCGRALHTDHPELRNELVVTRRIYRLTTPPRPHPALATDVENDGGVLHLLDPEPRQKRLRFRRSRQAGDGRHSENQGCEKQPESPGITSSMLAEHALALPHVNIVRRRLRTSLNITNTNSARMS